MTTEEFAKKMVEEMMEGQKRADEINRANGLKPYSKNPLDDWDEDDDPDDYLIPGDPNAF